VPIRVCMYMVRATRETEFGELESCTTHTHTPTRLLSILWRARFACNIYTHPHAGARIDGVTFGFGFLLFFHWRLSLFNRNAACRLRLRCRVEEGRYRNYKTRCTTRFDFILTLENLTYQRHWTKRFESYFVYCLGISYYYFIFPRRGILWVPLNVCAHQNTRTRVPDRK